MVSVNNRRCGNASQGGAAPISNSHLPHMGTAITLGI